MYCEKRVDVAANFYLLVNESRTGIELNTKFDERYQ